MGSCESSFTEKKGLFMTCDLGAPFRFSEQYCSIHTMQLHISLMAALEVQNDVDPCNLILIYAFRKDAAMVFT